MLQVRNETPFVPAMFLFPDEQGVETVYVTLKATFNLQGASLSIAPEQRPLTLTDTYWGVPGQSSLQYAGEAHLMKPGTDVLLVGDAYAPRERPVESCQVSVRVGPVGQQIQISGDRQWRRGLVSPSISAPEPFLTMPLRWERAFGGVHEIAPGQVLATAENPVGQGFRGRRSGAQMLGRALPNLEHPAHLIRSITDIPPSVGLGPVAPSWEPRRSHAGTYDEAWQSQRAPFLPQDFKPEYFCVAAPGMHAPTSLRGGEPVELVNVSRQGVQKFTLPACLLEVTVRFAGRKTQPALRLETVLLEPGEERICLSWRGATRCDKQALRVEEAHFTVKSLKGLKG